MAVYGTNNQDQVASLWVKCESGALVWYGNLEADQGTHQQEPEEHPADLVADQGTHQQEPEEHPADLVADQGTHQQEPEEHPADLVAKKNL